MVERLLAKVRAHSLDERLLAGERPEANRQLTVRSAMLLEPEYREGVARALREALDAAEHARRIFMKAQVHLREVEVISAGPLIRELADRVEAEAVVNPRGVILADRLIRDGDSPLFWPTDKPIKPAIEEALSALDPA